MVFESIIIGILIGYIRKGEIKKIGYTDIKGKIFFVLAFLIQISFLLLNTGLVNLKFNYYEIILAISYVLVLVGIGINFSIKFSPIVLIGGILNFINYIMNDWNIALTNKVSEKIFTKDILNLLLEEKIMLFKIIPDSEFLKGGFIPWNKMMLFPSALSIGDIIIFIGMVLVIQNLMIGRSYSRNSNLSFSDNIFK